MLRRSAAALASRRGYLWIVVALVVAACGSSTAPTGAPPAQTTPASSVGSPTVLASGPVSTGASPSSGATPQPVGGDPQALIETANLNDDSTLDNIGTLRFTQAGADAARGVLQAGGSPDALWAALWVYASAGTDPAPVEPLLTNGDPSVAALAAATLVGFGDAAGLDPLRQTLAADGFMSAAEPPLTLQEFALETLARYVTGTGAPDPETFADDGSAARAWQTWLDANRAQLHFDAGQGVWTVP